MNLADRFFNLYRGLERARGKNETLKTINDKGKRESKNQTLHATYDVACWEKHLTGKEGLGVIPITDEGKCVWGAIDLDIYPLDLIELEEKIKQYDLPMVVLKTKSGGAHLTAFWKDWQSCAEVRAKMAEISLFLGFGEREFYPKQVKLANKSDVGNWLNMPYFDFLNTERYAIINGTKASAIEFIEYAESLQMDSISDFIIPIEDSELLDGPPCLQQIVKTKAGQGERNNVLFNLGVYSRVKHESGWEEKIDYFNHKFIEPPLSHKEVANIVKSLEKKNYAYTCNNVPLCNHCNRESCKNREFGIHAFQHVDVGIVLDSITRLNSEPPMWVLSLEGVRSEVETDQLLSQERFRLVCVNAINKIPGRMKSEDWDKFMRNKLSEIEILDMPIETRVSDQVVFYVSRFFTSVPKCKIPSDIRLGKWLELDNGYALRGSDFLTFLTRFDIEVDPRRAWSLLSSNGVSIVNVKGQSLWLIPKQLYDPDLDEKLALPPKDIEYENFG